MKTIHKANKSILVCVLLIMGITNMAGQSSEELLETRAKEMHEALKSQNETDWENFIEANYSKRFLEKHDMSKHIGMFKRLSMDFSDSKISSLKVGEDKVLMAIERNSDKQKVTFEQEYDKDDDNKFNGLSIGAGELR